MTVAHACLMLHRMGHVCLCLHRDHLCYGEHSHPWSACSGAPHWAFSASDVAELKTEADLYALIVAKLRASQAARLAATAACVECGCTEDAACPDDGSGQPCCWVSRDPPLCSACAPVHLGASVEACDLGPCCRCEIQGPTVRNVIMLAARAPIPGRGWGCAVCDRPADGALAVLCDECLALENDDEDEAPRFACRGYPGTDGRIPITELTGEFGHDLSRHPELRGALA